MGDFKLFKKAVQTQFHAMLPRCRLFITAVDKNLLWETYLNSFPEGTNPIFKERREYDCNCCKSFIRNYGNIVVIGADLKIASIWDIDCSDETFKIVARKMSEYVKSLPIREVFVSKLAKLGTDKNHQQLTDGTIAKWEHFFLELPKSLLNTSSDSIESIQDSFRDSKNVFKRSMDELTLSAGETILDLINQKSLYRGDEFKSAITTFINYKKQYAKVEPALQDNWCWLNSVDNPVVRIRNTAIGTLLIDVSEGVDLDVAVLKFEKVVAPTNYKRPQAIITQRMIEEAEKKIIELGYDRSLARRYAVASDITVNNVIFADRDARKKMTSSPLASLKESVSEVSKVTLDKVETIGIEDFVTKIVPTVSEIEIMMQSKHLGNLMSLISPVNKDAPSMFKWSNNNTWCYNGDIADSMKQRVKAAGGKIDGVLRFSIQWNENGDNNNDFDAHCIEPNGNEIYFSNKRHVHPSSGMLDVDIITPEKDVAVENIIYTDLDRMKEGTYRFFVYNFNHRGGRSGFDAEIEFDGQILSFHYDRELKHHETIDVAEIQFSRKTGFKVLKSLENHVSTNTVWGVATNKFQRVSMLMLSPNYWDDQKGIGNKHYFFIVDGCKNESGPRGFFNEFLREELMPHKRVFEALGSKMRVDESDEQLSGLGFSTTQRNDLVVRVKGNFTRVLKINF